MEQSNHGRVTFGGVTVVPSSSARSSAHGGQQLRDMDGDSDYSYSDYSGYDSYSNSYTQSGGSNGGYSSSYSDSIESSYTQTQQQSASVNVQQPQKQRTPRVSTVPQQQPAAVNVQQPQKQRTPRVSTVPQQQPAAVNVQQPQKQRTPRVSTVPQQQLQRNTSQGPHRDSSAWKSTQSYTESYSSYDSSYSNSSYDYTNSTHVNSTSYSANTGNVEASSASMTRNKIAEEKTPMESMRVAPVAASKQASVMKQQEPAIVQKFPPRGEKHPVPSVQQMTVGTRSQQPAVIQPAAPWGQEVPTASQQRRQSEEVHHTSSEDVQPFGMGQKSFAVPPRPPVKPQPSPAAAVAHKGTPKQQRGGKPVKLKEEVQIDDITGSGSGYYTPSQNGSYSSFYTGSTSSYSDTRGIPGRSYTSEDYTATVRPSARLRPTGPPRSAPPAHVPPHVALQPRGAGSQIEDSYSYSYSYSSESIPEVKQLQPQPPAVENRQQQQEKDAVSLGSSESYYTGSMYDSEYYTYDYSQTETKTLREPGKLGGAAQDSKSLLATTTSLIKPTTSGSTKSEYASFSRSYEYSDDLDEEEGGVTSSESTDISSLVLIRTTVILSAPAEKEFRFHSVPRGCVVPHSSMEDTLSSFLDRLAELQIESMERNGVPQPISAPATGAEEAGSQRGCESLGTTLTGGSLSPASSVALAPFSSLRTFTRKSMIFALKVVGVERVEERYKILENVDMALPRDEARAMLEHHASRCLNEKVTSMFVSHDQFYSGEVPLSTALEILKCCGLACRTVGNLQVSLRPQVCDGEVLLCIAEQPQEALKAPEDCVEGEKRRMEERINEIIIPCCGKTWKYGEHKTYWSSETGDVFVGFRVACRGVTDKKTAVQLLRCLQALLYICHALMTVTVRDGRKFRVLYAPLVKTLLNPTVKGMPNSTSFLYEMALEALLNPRQKVQALASHRGLRDRYLCGGDDALLHDTMKPDLLVPAMPFAMSGNNQSELGALLSSTAQSCVAVSAGIWAQKGSEGCYVEVGIEKLRIREEVPPNAHCYCLVSARKSKDAEWMTAVVLPAVSVGKANKGGFKWKFGKKNGDPIFFAGAVEDSFYVEACYDVVDESGENLTCCVGHVLLSCGELKTGKLLVTAGSCYTAISTEEVVKPNAKTSSGGCCAPWRKVAGPPAKSLSVTVKQLRLKDVPQVRTLPSRHLCLRRHVSLMSLMCSAVINCRDSNSHPFYWLRQQQVQSCLMVAADPELMDVLQGQWTGC